MTPFEFVEFLDLADELAARTGEAARRTAISRAYYALLHAAYRALPPGLQGTVQYGAMHRVTWQLYTDSSVAACRQIGHAGLRLRDARVDADYRVATIVPAAQALRIAAHARQMLERLHQHGYQP